jgi:hypothetical protein
VHVQIAEVQVAQRVLCRARLARLDIVGMIRRAVGRGLGAAAGQADRAREP